MKRDISFMWINFSLFPLQSVKPAHRKNKFREVLNKDTVTKTGSTELAISGYVKPEHSFGENFYP